MTILLLFLMFLLFVSVPVAYAVFQYRITNEFKNFGRSIGATDIGRAWDSMAEVRVEGRLNGVEIGFELRPLRFDYLLEIDTPINLKTTCYVNSQNLQQTFYGPGLMSMPQQIIPKDPLLAKIYMIHAKHPQLAEYLVNSSRLRPYLESNLVKQEGEIAIHKGRLCVTRLLSGRSRFMKYHVLSPVLTLQWELVMAIMEVLKPFLTELPEELLCPYCRSHLEDRASAVICSVCATWHHRTCWEENGRCSIFGCEGEKLEIMNHDQLLETSE